MALRWGGKTRNPGGQGFQAICLDELAGDVMAGLGGAAGSAPEVRHQRPSPGKMHTSIVNIACQHECWWHNKWHRMKSIQRKTDNVVHLHTQKFYKMVLVIVVSCRMPLIGLLV